jgi:DegV family protein with EDD domain
MSEVIQRLRRRIEERFRPSAEELDLLEQASQIEGPVRVVVDAGCDLTPAQAEQLGVVMVPLIVRFGEQTFFDTDLSRDAFWERAAGPVHPQTSQPSIGAFEQAFAPLVEAGEAVFCITITGRHSGTYNAAWAAAQRFPGRVLVWDSLTLTAGIAIQVLEAAALAREGRPLVEIVQHAAMIRRNSGLTVVLNTVEYIRRGGRLDGAITVIEGLVRFLNIRPLLRLVRGELRVLGAARSFRRGLARLRSEALAAQPLSHLAVAHTRRPDEAARLAEEIAQEVGIALADVMVVEAGPALATHAGPGAVAVVVVKAPEQEDVPSPPS